MAKLKKADKAVEINVLPVMSLMTILIPTLISMVAFGKIAIVEVNLPERSAIDINEAPPPEPDDNAINLTIAISKEYLEIWARGGSLPKVFFKEMWTFRCKSDNDTITYDPGTLSASSPPKCRDNSTLEGGEDEKYRYSIETIHLWAIQKESEEDPGKQLYSVYSNSDSAYVDASNNEFISSTNGIAVGTVLATLAEGSARKLTNEDLKGITRRERSAYDELAKTLVAIHNRFIDSPDSDNIVVLADDDTAFDKIISVMDRARDAGFFKINLAKLAAGG